MSRQKEPPNVLGAHFNIVNPDIQEYVCQHIKREASILQDLKNETYEKFSRPQMLIGPEVGAVLQLLIRLMNAKNILEIGMFTGYSALTMALAMSNDGIITTCEVDPKAAEFARKYFERGRVSEKISVKIGQALETLKTLSGSFDLVFIDADKKNYLNYYIAAFPMVRVGGLIIFDNSLRKGRVLKPIEPDDEEAKAIDAANQYILEDDRVTNTFITVRDGLNIVYKLNN